MLDKSDTWSLQSLFVCLFYFYLFLYFLAECDLCKVISPFSIAEWMICQYSFKDWKLMQNPKDQKKNRKKEHQKKKKKTTFNMICKSITCHRLAFFQVHISMTNWMLSHSYNY